MEKVEEQKSLEGVVLLDELTGLYNRRYLKERLAEEIEKAGHQNRSFSLIMMDIDYFKEINDTYGHLSGDRAIEEVARI
ncbi:GGDEF domain-containing protein, partial [candidate division TA06 bacterium]|nr:GGDEF domain-containing protein [candidate division TA06 bacterium]